MISVHTTLQPGVEITFLMTYLENGQKLYLFIFQMNVKNRECCTLSWNHKSTFHFHLGLNN